MVSFRDNNRRFITDSLPLEGFFIAGNRLCSLPGEQEGML
jgi:hypothetical protein